MAPNKTLLHGNDENSLKFFQNATNEKNKKKFVYIYNEFLTILHNEFLCSLFLNFPLFLSKCYTYFRRDT